MTHKDLVGNYSHVLVSFVRRLKEPSAAIIFRTFNDQPTASHISKQASHQTAFLGPASIPTTAQMEAINSYSELDTNLLLVASHFPAAPTRQLMGERPAPG